MKKCQLKAIHGSPMDDKEALTPQDRLQLAPKHYTQVPHILQRHKIKLKVNMKQLVQRPEIPDLRLVQTMQQKMQQG